MRGVLGTLALASLILLLPDSAATQGVALQSIASGLVRPTSVAQPRAGSLRLFITLQGGKIVVYDTQRGKVSTTPFLDVSSLVGTCFNCGLLSMAFDPAFGASGGYLYVFYVDNVYRDATNCPDQAGATCGNIVVARYRSNGTVADPSSARIVLTVAHPHFDDHYGGQLAFGPDGYLYIAIGDGGRNGPPANGVGDVYRNAQNPARLLGKILRIDVAALDTTGTYAIPASNPFAFHLDGTGASVATQPCGPEDPAAAQMDPAARSYPGTLAPDRYCPEIWALGLRNAWRFNFDRLTGDLYVGDVGQDLREEIDVQPASAAGGANYGWPVTEGDVPYRDDPVYVAPAPPPALVYDHSAGKCSVTGGYRYRGSQATGLLGQYVFGDLCSGQIWGWSGGTAPATQLLDTTLTIASFGEDSNGELYVVHWDARRGAVYRMVNSKRPR
jgi:glucose/arabinose dehydrogenase